MKMGIVLEFRNVRIFTQMSLVSVIPFGELQPRLGGTRIVDSVNPLVVDCDFLLPFGEVRVILTSKFLLVDLIPPRNNVDLSLARLYI